MKKLVIALTGASGMLTAQILVNKSPWPVTLVCSRLGRKVYEQEVGPFAHLTSIVSEVWSNDDLTATISSGTVPTVGMVIMPCSVNTLAKVAHGIADSLITRAAHCHLKERRPLILGLRETPLTLMNCENAAKVIQAGGSVMPISPPFYMIKRQDPESISLSELMGHYVNHVLALLSKDPSTSWEEIRDQN